MEFFTCSLKDLRSGVLGVCAISVCCPEKRSSLTPSVRDASDFRQPSDATREEESFSSKFSLVHAKSLHVIWRTLSSKRVRVCECEGGGEKKSFFPLSNTHTHT